MAKDHCEECEMNAIRKGCPVLPCGRYIKSYIASKNGVIKVVETWQMIVPMQERQKKPFPKEIRDVIRADVLRVFSGDTEVEVVGSWKQDQRIDIEENIRIEVDVYTEDHDKAEAYMAEAKKVLASSLKQDKIYVTFSLSRFEFLLPEEFRSDLGLTIPLPKNLDQIMVDLCVTLAAPCK